MTACEPTALDAGRVDPSVAEKQSSTALEGRRTREICNGDVDATEASAFGSVHASVWQATEASAFGSVDASDWQRNAAPRFDALLLVFIAGAALTVARAGAAWNPTWMAVRAVCELAMIVALSLVLRRRARSLTQAHGFVAIIACAAVVYPFAAEFVLRWFAGGSEPLELLMLTSLQLTAVTLAVFCHLPRLGGSAVLLSSFLLLFVTTMSSNRTTLVLGGLYGVLVLWWLMGAYWDRLAGTFVASTVERRIPVRVSVIGGVVIVLMLLAGLIGTTGSAAVALQGFLPTSGGSQWHDPHARSGVGDGDAMVAAKEDAMSFGPVESELFLDSDMPTLYDMFNDMYGEPPNPRKKQERNIGLAPSEVKETEQQIAKTERSGRQFSAVRRKSERNPRSLDNRKSPAMLYVVGRVPLHLALERYDTFDGRKWTHSGVREKDPPIRLKTQNGKPWAHFTRVGASPIHRGLEPHALKIINLKTNRFPSPPHLTAVHVDKVDQPDFFGWSEDGVACMPVRKHIPQLTVIHLRSQSVNLQPLREAHFQLANIQKNGERQAGSSPHEEWTRDVPRGWRQVEAVVEQLRTGFAHDPNAPAPEDCSDVVAHFLQAKRGPAYLFATTAAVLLRECGYGTRLVAGLYANEVRYDHRAGQTAVLADDVHVWVEVTVDGGTWVPIEPTPGYQPPRESLTWQQRAGNAMAACVAWANRNAVNLLCEFALAVLLIVTRRTWLDALAVAVWRVLGLPTTRARLMWTIWLIEWRAWLVGRSRPKHYTVASWYAPLLPAAPADVRPVLAEFLQWTDRLLYAPAGIHAAEHTAIDAACRSAVSASTCKALASSFLHPTVSHRR